MTFGLASLLLVSLASNLSFSLSPERSVEQISLLVFLLLIKNPSVMLRLSTYAGHEVPSSSWGAYSLTSDFTLS